MPCSVAAAAAADDDAAAAAVVNVAIFAGAVKANTYTNNLT